jgi:hypothetical protein
VRPALPLVLATENLFSGPEAVERLTQAVSGRASLDAAAADLGVDLQGLASTPGICLSRPRRMSWDESLQARAGDLRLNAATELDEALAAHPESGELVYHASRRVRLASFDAKSPWGADKTLLALNAVGAPIGDAARRPLASALARRDIFTFLEGGEMLPLAPDEAAVRQRRLFQQLPNRGAEVRTERRQPVTLRVYRGHEATTVCMINESPWPVDVQVALEAPASAGWRELGDSSAQATGAAATIASPPAGDGQSDGQPWTVTLPPYGLAARRYQTRSLRVGAWHPTVSNTAQSALAARIAEVDQRMRSLDVERPYPLLENADFERVDPDNAMPAWQPRIGKVGHVAIDGTAAHSGVRALHFRAGDDLGVAAHSQVFPSPATGQLLVRAQVRVSNLAPEARLYAWIEYDAGGVQRLIPKLLVGTTGGEWSTCEALFDELPLTGGGLMRVQFHLAGAGEAWLDDVELFDLRFGEAQRYDLAKGLFAAKSDLEAGRVVDCLRRVDSYWPQYLVEHLPAARAPVDSGERPPVSVASRPDDVAGYAAPTTDQSQGEDDGGLGNRMRSVLPRAPRIFRR